jgi:hypothetical protein
MVTLQLRLTADRAEAIADTLRLAREVLTIPGGDEAIAEDEARLRHAAARARRREAARNVPNAGAYERGESWRMNQERKHGPA